MGKFTYHGLQHSIEDVPQPTSIVTGANLKKPSCYPAIKEERHDNSENNIGVGCDNNI
jgi:hypothetical protein